VHTVGFNGECAEVTGQTMLEALEHIRELIAHDGGINGGYKGRLGGQSRGNMHTGAALETERILEAREEPVKHIGNDQDPANARSLIELPS
jgi:hypothetical protein